MSAFQAYGGAYEHQGKAIRWRCYATAPVYEVRTDQHMPLPAPPEGRKWLMRSRYKNDVTFGWLVDGATEDFSQILLQVEPGLDAPVRTEPARA